MRKIYEYKVIRYFPNSFSDEFINIGVMLDGTNQKERILNESEAKHLYCSALIGENKKFYGVIEYLNNLVEKGILYDEHHYFHNFEFSERKQFISEKNENEIVEDLFENYIGYKFQSEEKLDKRIRLIQKSYSILESEFKFNKNIHIYKAEKFDFEIKHQRTQKIYHSNVGSIANKQDIVKMIMETPLHKEKNHYYNFLNIATSTKNNDYKERLDLNNIEYSDYSNEEKIVEYFEKLIA